MAHARPPGKDSRGARLLDGRWQLGVGVDEGLHAVPQHGHPQACAPRRRLRSPEVGVAAAGACTCSRQSDEAISGGLVWPRRTPPMRKAA